MSKKGLNKKEVSNMLKLALICIGFIILILLCRRWYLNHLTIENNIPVLNDVVTHQIKANEFYNFVNDNDTAIIYMCVSSDENCRNLETDLKSLIQKNSLEDIIVYLDLNSADDIDKFLEDIKKEYEYTDDINEYPTALYFENGVIKNAITGKNITKADIENFLKEIDVIS